MNLIFRHILMLVFSFAVLTFCYAQKGTVAGTVFGSEGVLPNAIVSVENNTVLTNQQGEFTLTINPGTYTFTVTHSGYKKLAQQITVEANRKTMLQYTLVADEQLGEVVVLGSRSAALRTNLNTPVPVDVFTSQQLVQTGQVSLMQMLSFSAPSVNASRPIVNEPITLRGLNPDQLLILVNGVRRHSMADITPGGIRGVLGNGSVPNDLNSIPVSAIEKIEILRDGAAAQYGSDAIAGVINIVLKKSTDKTNVRLLTGQYYAGDGATISIGINRGMVLNKKGFLNFSANFRHTASTYRGGKYDGTVYQNIPPGTPINDSLRIRAKDDSIVAARGFNRNNISHAGSSEHTLGGIVVNGGYPIGKKTELFWTAMANERKSNHLNGYTFPKNAARVNPELFPNGYLAQPYYYNHDISVIAGIKSETKKGTHWKYTTAYGNNTNNWHIKNTNNPSQYYTLGKNAPTQFYTGSLIFSQLTNNIEVSKNFSAAGYQRVNLSWGAEWRMENFRMIEGEEAAWRHYDPVLRRKQSGTTGQVVDSANAVHNSRNVLGTYIDLEIELTKRLLVDVAGRYEYYSDFGNNLAGKIAARYKLSEAFSVRGSFNNGFRAPSLQQRYYSFTNRTGVKNGIAIVSGTFSNDSYVAKAFGVPSLQAERSLNVSGGIAAAFLRHFRFTADAYWIEIRDRIVLSGNFDTTKNPAVRELLRSIPEVTSANFFSNAVNTTTRGVDFVLNGNWKISKRSLMVMLAGNFTQTRFFGKIKTVANLPADSVNTNSLFNRATRGRMELEQPDSKVILSLNYKMDKYGLLLRNTRFGSTAFLSADLADADDEHFSPKILTDISVNYSPKTWLNFTLGVNNVLNVYPDKLKDYRNTQEGRLIYGREATPFGFYGGYYFANITFNW